MGFSHRTRVLSAIGLLFTIGCTHGSLSTPAPTSVTPTVTAVNVSGAGSSVVGDTAQLTAIASLSDGSTKAVTSEATWESSNQAVVTVTAAGIATFVGQGDADVKATYKSVSGSSRVTVANKPVPKFTLTGTVTDSTNGNPLPNVNARVLDGPDAGRTGVTDATGRFTITSLSAGTFLVQFTRSDYETRSVGVSLNGGDAAVAVQITAVQSSVTRFYGTYNTSLTIQQQSCDFPFPVGPTGTFKIEGNTSGSSMTITIVERGTTRTYTGSIRGDGSFNGNGGGVIAGFSPPKQKHEYTGRVSGTSTGSRVEATEFVTFTIPCPGATMRIGYSGSK
jgi:hypothetical protein